MTMSNLTAPVSSNDHAQGKTNAPWTLVEYGDYQCPSCGDAHPIVKQLQQHFGDQLRRHWAVGRESVRTVGRRGAQSHDVRAHRRGAEPAPRVGRAH